MYIRSVKEQSVDAVSPESGIPENSDVARAYETCQRAGRVLRGDTQVARILPLTSSFLPRTASPVADSFTEAS
jgi:hypothetical protein